MGPRHVSDLASDDGDLGMPLEIEMRELLEDAGWEPWDVPKLGERWASPDGTYTCLSLEDAWAHERRAKRLLDPGGNDAEENF